MIPRIIRICVLTILLISPIMAFGCTRILYPAYEDKFGKVHNAVYFVIMQKREWDAKVQLPDGTIVDLKLSSTSEPAQKMLQAAIEAAVAASLKGGVIK